MPASGLRREAGVFDEERLRELGRAERLRLIRALVALESPDPAGDRVLRRRQVLIICLVVLATLLCCDAWFDVLLDARTAGFELSLLSAVVIELPLAALAGWGARRLLLTSVAVVRRYEGEQGPAPTLWRARLIGGSLAPQLSEPDSGDTDAQAYAPDRPRDGPAA
jgi:hypothetical protein